MHKLSYPLPGSSMNHITTHSFLKPPSATCILYIYSSRFCIKYADRNFHKFRDVIESPQVKKKLAALLIKQKIDQRVFSQW
jgi:hypothetical protein